MSQATFQLHKLIRYQHFITVTITPLGGPVVPDVNKIHLILFSNFKS